MAREELVELGASLFDRRLTFGRTGNLNTRSGDHPTRPLTDDQAEQLRREDP